LAPAGRVHVQTSEHSRPTNGPHQIPRGLNRFDKPGCAAEFRSVSKLERIETEVRQLPRGQALALQDWLADYLEAQAEVSPEFVASIERGEADLREGRVRVRQP